MNALNQATYSPAVFNVGTMEQAKRIILTPEGDLTTEQRWLRETPYLLSLIEQTIRLNEHSTVLDYGCGIGRMAKALIDKYNCHVIGVDISPSMRALAASYVSSDNFVVCSPEALSWLGVKFDAALAIWVLQHCYDVKSDIARIHRALRKQQKISGQDIGGSLFVVNDHRRIVPTKEAMWVNDGQDVRNMLLGSFDPVTVGALDREHIGDVIADASYWAAFRVRG